MLSAEYHSGYEMGYVDCKAEYVDQMNKKLYNIRKLIENNIDYAGQNAYTGEDEWILTDKIYKAILKELE